MLTAKLLGRPCLWHQCICIARNTMVAYKNKYGIVEIFFFFGCFNKLLITKIGVTESVHFFQRFETIFFQSIVEYLYFFKRLLIFFGNGIRPMVISRLNNRKKGLLL